MSDDLVARTPASVWTLGRDLVARTPIRVESCAEAALSTSRTRQIQQRGHSWISYDRVAFGYRFAIWALEHPQRNGDAVTHWGLTVDPRVEAAEDDGSLGELLKYVWELTGAKQMAYARSCHSLDRSRVLDHFRWHSDGTAPELWLCGKEVGITDDAWRACTDAEFWPTYFWGRQPS